jgi:hypothetical protein
MGSAGLEIGALTMSGEKCKPSVCVCVCVSEREIYSERVTRNGHRK